MIAFFRTLRGKLILTYTTVTVLALLALEVTVLLVVFAIARGLSSDTLAYLSDVVGVLPPQARPYVQGDRPDLPGLQAWLEETYDAGYASLPPQNAFDRPAAPIVQTQPIYVLAPDGTVLAAAPAGARSLVGRQYSPPANIARSADVLDNAVRMETQSSLLSALGPDGNYFVAVPVRRSLGAGPLAAIIIVTVKPPPTTVAERWPVILGIVLATAFVLLLAVAPFGALFGFVMSRGLTRRLKTLAAAADAWSEGDFSVQPRDRSQDEISYLGGRMRRMAEGVQALLQTQHELAQLEERNRLARELHDTVKQQTFATLMQVRAAKNLLGRDPNAAREHLDQAEELIKTSQRDLGLMIAELRPTTLDGKGLAAALRDYLEAWSQHSRIPAELEVQGERRLPLEIEQALFRVAQEALSNVARHSRASAATVGLAFSGDEVTLSVADNGVGLDADATNDGFGLQSMRDRMAGLHGALEVRSTGKAGTVITARAPAAQRERS